MLRGSIAFFLVWLATFVAMPVMAWTGTEHAHIGGEAYNRACAEVRMLYGKTQETRVLERLSVACNELAGVRVGENGFAYEPLAAEWSALAADHSQTPEQLTSVGMGDVAVDYRVMTRIATTNYRHFHPASVTSWRSEHLKALEASAAAASVEGVALVERFEAALAIEAFAQHYLQDSFAAGHMGFNRVASSNAAALTYHNEMSKQGRCVANQHGRYWYTFGDGNLLRSPEGAEQVIAAASASFKDFLEAFVDARANTTTWQDVWARLPALFDESVENQSACDANGPWQPLRTVSKPAQSVSTLEVLTVTDSSIYTPAARGVMVGVAREFAMTIPIGYRVIQNRIYGAVGTTVEQIGPRALLLEYGYFWHVGTSFRGTLTHDIGFAQFFYWSPQGQGYDNYANLSQRVMYGMNVELGRFYLRGQVGPSYAYRWGLHVGAGVGWVGKSKK